MKGHRLPTPLALTGGPLVPGFDDDDDESVLSSDDDGSASEERPRKKRPKRAPTEEFASAKRSAFRNAPHSGS